MALCDMRLCSWKGEKALWAWKRNTDDKKRWLVPRPETATQQICECLKFFPSPTPVCDLMSTRHGCSLVDVEAYITAILFKVAYRADRNIT